MLHMCGWKHVTIVLAVMVCGMYQLDTVPGITNTASYLVIQQLSTFSFLFLSFNKPSDHQFKVVDYFLETASNVCKHSRPFPSSCLVSDPSYRGLNWGSFILCFQNNFLECEGSLCLMHCTIIKDILLIRKQVILMQLLFRIIGFVCWQAVFIIHYWQTQYITGKSMVLQLLKMGVSLLGR